MSEIEDMIQYVMDDNFNKANDIFGDAIGAKVSDALEQEKIALASDIFNGSESEEVEEVEEDDIDLDDIDLDDIDLDDIDLDDIDLDDTEEQE